MEFGIHCEGERIHIVQRWTKKREKKNGDKMEMEREMECESECEPKEWHSAQMPKHFIQKIILHVIPSTLFAEFKYTYVNKAILHFTSVKAISGSNNNPKWMRDLFIHDVHVISIFIMNVFRNYLLFVSFINCLACMTSLNYAFIVSSIWILCGCCTWTMEMEECCLCLCLCECMQLLSMQFSFECVALKLRHGNSINI